MILPKFDQKTSLLTCKAIQNQNIAPSNRMSDLRRRASWITDQLREGYGYLDEIYPIFNCAQFLRWQYLFVGSKIV
jgi:hypothetical protein